MGKKRERQEQGSQSSSQSRDLLFKYRRTWLQAGILHTGHRTPTEVSCVLWGPPPLQPCLLPARGRLRQKRLLTQLPDLAGAQTGNAGTLLRATARHEDGALGWAFRLEVTLDVTSSCMRVVVPRTHSSPGHSPAALSAQGSKTDRWDENQSLKENVLVSDQHENATEGPTAQPQAAENCQGCLSLSLQPDCSTLWSAALLHAEQSRPQLFKKKRNWPNSTKQLCCCLFECLLLKINQSCQRALTSHRQTTHHNSLPLLSLFGKGPTVSVVLSPTPL